MGTTGDCRLIHNCLQIVLFVFAIVVVVVVVVVGVIVAFVLSSRIPQLLMLLVAVIGAQFFIHREISIFDTQLFV